MTEIEAIFLKKECEEGIISSAKQQLFAKRIDRFEDTFLPKLDANLAGLYEEYKRILEDYIDEVKSVYFTDGFITGGKIMSEVLTGDN